MNALKKSTFKKVLLPLLFIASGFFLQKAEAVCTTGPITYIGSSWDFNAHGGDSPANPVLCDVIIPSGATAYLANTDLFLDEGVDIIIEEGATMVAYLCEFKSTFPNTKWEGFKVWGDESQSQTGPDQGKLFLKRCRIENPVIGVLCRSEGSIYDGGGIIVAEDNDFVKPSKYGIFLDGRYDFPSASRILGNTFTSDVVQGDPYLDEADWQFVRLDKMVNVIIEDNQFFNSAPASDDDHILRGTGIHANGSTFLAKGNTFARLWAGIYNKGTGYGDPHAQNSLANPSHIRENNFYNNIIGIHCDKALETWILENNFVINDANTQTLDPFGFTYPYFREFTGIYVGSIGAGGSQPWGGFVIESNDLTVDIDMAVVGADQMKWKGIDLHGGDILQTVRKNTFTLSFPVADQHGIGTYVGVEASSGGDYIIECNDFFYDETTTRDQIGIEAETGSSPLVIGDPVRSASNSFFTFPSTCSSTTAQYRGTGGSIWFYELPNFPFLNPGLNCWTLGSTRFNTTSANLCLASTPPAVIPGSIEPAPDLPPPPTSKMAANDLEKDPLFTIWPNPAQGTTINIQTETGGKLSILDLQGRIIGTPTNIAAGRTTLLETASLKAGMYLVVLETDGARTVRKLVIE